MNDGDDDAAAAGGGDGEFGFDNADPLLCGIAGGGVAARLFFGVDQHQYWSTAWQILVYQDVMMGLAKPILFGFIIATIGCYYGVTTRGGTQGVGRATTQAVVASSILIIAVDFFATRLATVLFGQ